MKNYVNGHFLRVAGDKEDNWVNINKISLIEKARLFDGSYVSLGKQNFYCELTPEEILKIIPKL